MAVPCCFLMLNGPNHPGSSRTQRRCCESDEQVDSVSRMNDGRLVARLALTWGAIPEPARDQDPPTGARWKG